MAACEAALESDWGTSDLAAMGNNLFGAKQQMHPVFRTLHIPTREFLNHAWLTEDAAFVAYPDWQTCFSERMNTLKRLSNSYPHYYAARRAATAESFVEQVSLSWSTDPDRARKCIAIYHAHLELLTETLK